jgi:putative sporulation protein YtaF
LRNYPGRNVEGANAMQHLLYAFLIALTNNFDNIGARIAYSIQGTKISTLINLWISVITFVISLSAAVSGTMISGSLGKRFSSIMAMVFLVAIGSWMILEQHLKRWYSAKLSRENSKGICDILLKPENADMDNSKHIDFKEATLLGIALSINNVGGGLSAGMIGLNSFLVGFLSALLSFIALWAGNHVAEFFIRRNIANKAAFAGGVLLIAIGIGQLL